MSNATTALSPYRGYTIGASKYFDGVFFVHQSHDGPQDQRAGWAKDEDEARRKIDKIEGPKQ